MKRPTKLVPNRFIKIVYKDPEGHIRFTVAITYQCYDQTWKEFFTGKPACKTHVNAKRLSRYHHTVDWDVVLYWEYIDFDPYSYID